MAKGIIDYNGNKIEFEPPTPTVDKRGGIYAETAEDTTDMTEVVVGADGKGYVDKVDLSNCVPKTRKILNSDLSRDLTVQDFLNLAIDNIFKSMLLAAGYHQIVDYAESSTKLAKKDYVDALIEAITTIDIQVVDELPAESISTTTIYLVPKPSTEDDDIYDEYIYVNENWEHIGNTQTDLSNYIKNTDIVTNSSAGIVKVNNGVYGIKVIEGGIIGIIRATDDDIESLTDKYKVIVPANLKKAVETIGGAIDSLDTENKANYVSALNEVLRYATRTKSWRKIRTVTVPGVEAIGTTVNGVKYSGGTPSSDEQIGVCSVTVTTDEDGNVLAGRDITDVAIRFVPVEATNINQGFIQLGDQTVVYFVGLRGASSVSPRRFIVHKAGNYVSNDSSNTSEYALRCVNITDIDRINFRGHESTSILGEGATLDFYAYGYWDDLEEEV